MAHLLRIGLQCSGRGRRQGFYPCGQEDPLEEEMATHCNILAWRIPWTEELVGYSPWGCKESDARERLSMSKDREPWASFSDR